MEGDYGRLVHRAEHPERTPRVCLSWTVGISAPSVRNVMHQHLTEPYWPGITLGSVKVHAQ